MTYVYSAGSKHELQLSLAAIADRYYRGGAVAHFHDCMIFRSLEVYDFVFCDCGLLYDLTQIYHLAEVLYAPYAADLWLQQRQEVYKPQDPAQQAEWQEAEAILYEVFGAPEVPNLLDLKEDYEIEKQAILECLGNDAAILGRLEAKLQQELRDRWKYEKYRK